MPLEDNSCCAGVFALFANERLLSTVNQHVDFQMRSFVACVAALVATVGLLSVMLLKPMLFQVIAHLGVEISLYTQVGHLCWQNIFYFIRCRCRSRLLDDSGNKAMMQLKSSEESPKIKISLKSESINLILLRY